jgi:hypothetical protein
VISPVGGTVRWSRLYARQQGLHNRPSELCWPTTVRHWTEGRRNPIYHYIGTYLASSDENGVHHIYLFRIHGVNHIPSFRIHGVPYISSFRIHGVHHVPSYSLQANGVYHIPFIWYTSGTSYTVISPTDGILPWYEIHGVHLLPSFRLYEVHYSSFYVSADFELINNSLQNTLDNIKHAINNIIIVGHINVCCSMKVRYIY